ncbi:MAG: dTDP-glucose 4,6-dehydratase [Anaerolineales bacterium]
MQNVLITGGAGFIGSNFVRYILRTEPDVRVTNLDALTYSGSLENLEDLPNADHYTFVKGDICDAELAQRLLREHAIDTIVHFAAETHVDRSILEPEQFIKTNILGTFTLLEAARRVWLDGPTTAREQIRFHHISTDEVYGSLAPGDPAWNEERPYAPNSPYAASKAASDHLVRSYGHTFGLPYTLTNCTNNYGPYQFPEKLIPLVILNALDGKPLPIYGDGQQVRDWLHVEDHCEAIWLVLKRGLPGTSYNIGGGNQPANLTIVETICDILDDPATLLSAGLQPDSTNIPHKQLIHFVKDRPGHDRRYAMDIQKIRRDLDWQPRHSMEQGLRETVIWYLAHPEWVSTIRQRKGYTDWLDENYTRR